MKNKFISLLGRYSKSVDFNNQCWNELQNAYSQESRAYHNLTHLENMLSELAEVEKDISDLDAVLFALFYHDVVYDASKTDNEHQSALLIQERISSTDFLKVECVMNLINATKGHEASNNQDVNLFIDLDLSILGQDEETYKRYCNQIRREYQIYSDEVYNDGRKKVLEHLLNSGTIFKTTHFKNKYEKKALENMRNELLQLS